MDKHGIDVSVVRCFFYFLDCLHILTINGLCLLYLLPLSSANPWLDFLSAPEANNLAKELNEDLEEFCSSSPDLDSPSSGGSLSMKRLYGLGLLPLVPKVSPLDLLEAITQISSLPHLKGVIMGTQGLGRGLDDEELEPVWRAIDRNGLVVFLHPHYGVPSSMWGERDNGHVLPLALGFPFETTIVRSTFFLLVYAAQGNRVPLSPLGHHANDTRGRPRQISFSQDHASPFRRSIASAFVSFSLVH